MYKSLEVEGLGEGYGAKTLKWDRTSEGSRRGYKDIFSALIEYHSLIFKIVWDRLSITA